MRVAYFTESLPPMNDGVGITFAQIVPHLERSRIDFRFFSPFAPPQLPWRNRVIKIKSLPPALYPDQNIAAQIRQDLYRKIDSLQPQLIHVTNTSFISLMGMNYATERKLPIVASCHDRLSSITPTADFANGDQVDWSYARWFYNQCSMTLANSAEEVQVLAHHGIKPVRMWPFGVDTSIFGKKYPWQKFRKALGARRSPLILCADRLSHDQSPDLLITACRLLRARGLDFRLRFTGNGPLRSELQRQAPWAEFRSCHDSKQLAEAFFTADLMALPSYQDSEINARLVLQAGTAGLPVVGVRCCSSVEETIKDGVTGLLADFDDPTDFAAKVAALINDSQLRKLMGRNGRQEALARDWMQVARQLVACYQELVSNPSLAGRVIQRGMPQRAPKVTRPQLAAA